jgi:NADPH-dependent ferric siderophore reductase
MARAFSYVPAYVVDLSRRTPHLHRVVIGGSGAAGWQASGVPDESVLLVLPRPGGALRMPDDQGGGDPTRWYTVRRYDPDSDELTIDVAEHPEGVMMRWMRSAAPGDPVGVSSVTSWWSRPADATWQVLIGDLTALPAISRALEELSTGTSTSAVIEVPDAADEQHLDAPPGASIGWLHTPVGQPSRLPEVARSLVLPAGPGYVYCAGEAAAARAVRRHLRHERRLPAGSYSVSGYWRHRSEEWSRRFQAAEHQLGLAELYARFEAADADKEALTDEMDRRLDAAGL